MYDQLDSLGVAEGLDVECKVIHEYSPRLVAGLTNFRILVLESQLYNLQGINNAYYEDQTLQ